MRTVSYRPLGDSFGITSETLRIGSGRAKGYEAADFADAFDRYLPYLVLSNRDTVTTCMDEQSPAVWHRNADVCG